MTGRQGSPPGVRSRCRKSFGRVRAGSRARVSRSGRRPRAFCWGGSAPASGRMNPTGRLRGASCDPERRLGLPRRPSPAPCEGDEGRNTGRGICCRKRWSPDPARGPQSRHPSAGQGDAAGFDRRGTADPGPSRAGAQAGQDPARAGATPAQRRPMDGDREDRAGKAPMPRTGAARRWPRRWGLTGPPPACRSWRREARSPW